MTLRPLRLALILVAVTAALGPGFGTLTAAPPVGTLPQATAIGGVCPPAPSTSRVVLPSRLMSVAAASSSPAAGAGATETLSAQAVNPGVAGTRILAWNNLGMHCMDSSYAEFSILPPYNTIEAQLIVGGKLVTSGSGYTLTYEAVPDPTGSINTTSVGKGNWFTHAQALYGKAIGSADEGLSFWNMPGALNTPQAMLFEAFNLPAPGVSTPVNWFRAEGIPITPWDDNLQKNPYPMMRITARNALNVVIAQSDIVLPVSDEMDCRACHGANTSAAAMPTGGWISIPGNKDREFRLNVLKLHDDRETALHPALYADALAAISKPAGLYASAMANSPVLCAACHASEALGAPSFSSANGKVPQLTTSVHAKHATVIDPKTSLSLDSSANRSACYTCHPGSTTRCLRGAMGSAVAADGSMAIQCQNCHGNMSKVGAATRTGWFEEPTCQTCHTGTATSNNGQIRYTSSFEANGTERVPVNDTFATTAHTPAMGLSLYRFSIGHGGLQCSACHGSTHAEFPASHDNDNVRNIQLQGHEGTTVECNTCHTSMPNTITGGPHGMHPTDQAWIESHHDAVSSVGVATCFTCHGADGRGTELSRMQGTRSMSVSGLGTFTLYRGATVGCYTCHQGPSKSDRNLTANPVTGNVAASTLAGIPVDLVLPGAVPGVAFRVLKQPKNGTVGLIGGVATYFPFEGFTGVDSFTFAGYDGSKNTVTSGGAKPGVGTVTVGAANPALTPPVITLEPVTQTAIAGTNVTLDVAASGSTPLQYQWYRNGWPIGGATSASLMLSGVTPANSGVYSATASNGAGTAASAAATLTVLDPPVVTTNPATQTIVVGSGVTFSVVATGSAPLSYAWYKNGAKISGATGASYGISAVKTTDAGTYYAVVSNAVGSATSTTAVLTVTVPPPTVATFTPTSGPAGTTVTFTGTYLVGPPTVTFNGVAATNISAASSMTSMTARVPAGATTGPVVVTTSGGSVTAGTFTVTTPPSVSGFTPTSGRVGTAITITGTNLRGTTQVRINGTAAPFTVISATSVVAGIPAGATTGKVSVTTPSGTASSAGNFSVSAGTVAPTISSISPTSGAVGRVITVSGTNLGAAISAKVGAVPAMVLVLSATRVSVVVPAGAVTGKVSVTTTGGTATSAATFTVLP